MTALNDTSHPLMVAAESKPFRWSFSQWETYNTCPAKWHYGSVLKLPRKPPGPAAARGLDMHNRCDDFITGKIDEDMLVWGDTTKRFGAKKSAVINRKYVPMLAGFRDHPNGDRYAELKLSFDNDWHLVGTLTAQTTWVIAIMDAVKVADGIAHVGEWKSGMPKDSHADQRKLYSLAALRKWYGIEEVQTTTYYLEDTAPPQRTTVKATAEQKLKDLWQVRVDQMTSDKICAPRPGDYCKWMCDFAASKGGPCPYGA